jgi:hypothetical protein
MALTVVTGLVDAVSVLRFGVFTANMTGNVFFLGFALARAQGFSIARSLTSLVAFLAVAAIGGRICVAMPPPDGDAVSSRLRLAKPYCFSSRRWPRSGLTSGRRLPLAGFTL